MKTMIRKVMDSVKNGKMDEAQQLLPRAFKAIDTAAKKNIIHQKNAARKKARLSRMVTAGS